MFPLFKSTKHKGHPGMPDLPTPLQPANKKGGLIAQAAREKQDA
jgi:hypothetical protein